MTDHIRVGDTCPRVQYLANGVQTSFPYPFPIRTESDLEIWLGPVPLARARVTVTGCGLSSGGTAILATAPAAGTIVTLRRRMALCRTSDYQNDGIIHAKVMNDEMDYQVMAIQQVAEEAGRAVRRSPTSASTADLTLPEPVPGALLGWNDSGTGLANDPLNAVMMSGFVAETQAAQASAGFSATLARTAAAAAAADRGTVADDRTRVAEDRLAVTAAAAEIAADRRTVDTVAARVEIQAATTVSACQTALTAVAALDAISRGHVAVPYAAVPADRGDLAAVAGAFTTERPLYTLSLSASPHDYGSL